MIMAKKATRTKKTKKPDLSFNFGANRKPRKKTGIRYDKRGNAYGS
jgi:hypothetical protein